MDAFKPETIPDPAVRRISLYLRQLEAFRKSDRKTISSKQLGSSLGLTDAQVRRDLGYFGQFGHPGVGYRVDELIAKLRQILGTDKTWNVLLVGVGNLGRALCAYAGFEAKGFKLVAVFDRDPSKIGGQLGRFTVRPLSDLPDVVRRQEIRVAMLAVPADSAQEVVDLLVSAGIRGILNFAPAPVNVPEHVSLNSVDLALQLEQISFQVSLAMMKK
jgi:redox-sensing transcriptional repressor